MNRKDWINNRKRPRVIHGIEEGQIWEYNNPDNKKVFGKKFKILGIKHLNLAEEMVWNIKWFDKKLNNPYNNRSQEAESWIKRNCKKQEA